ncbi:S-adenosyl-L-methionine-dependent methyltransferase [Phyllosticta citriasiana]|uniref:S-adenosyl-L-methionine-dependent methyltransferase n=1 Tax=Phyllosticta citriasiana TaxID=595635 RepID=UPI0030FD91FF
MTTETGRGYHNTSSVYFFPNDTVEQDRLNAQSSAIKSMLEGRVTLAPLPPNPSRILDIGCGTGHATLDIARQYPSAQVYGLDISPVPEKSVKEAPPNLHFLTGNILDVHPTAAASSTAHSGDEAPPSSDELNTTLQPNTFTHVFARLLVMGMNNWPGLISRAYSLLAPGGYLELQELDIWFRDANGTHIEHEFEDFMGTAMRERGLDMRAGPNMAERMRAAGFVDVEVHRRRWVVKALPGEPVSEMTRYASVAMPANIDEIARKLAKPQTDRWGKPEAVEQMKKTTHERVFSQPGAHCEYFVTIGRKPEAQREKSE